MEMVERAPMASASLATALEEEANWQSDEEVRGKKLAQMAFDKVVLANAPSALFYCTALFYFVQIRPFGFNRVVHFSRIFRLKLHVIRALLALHAFSILHSILLQALQTLKDLPEVA
mmetsp:Transcript_6719/g.11279  ORF Transcript_6719/g.11279 Transcript_6719/m.11279 type:complete len:117 (-) Transcript_6719:2473-2823(-)